MSNILVDTVSVAVVLCVIVLIHELGHFLAAKAFGVRVLTFSLGFGTRLAGVEYHGTDYRISLLPLGGYVKMAGETLGDVHTGQPDEFSSKPRWQRLVIALAGPAMNVLLAIGLLIPVYMRDYQRNSFLDHAAVVSAVDPNSAAARAGIEPMDRIIRINGVNDPTWEQVGMQAAVSVDHPMNVTLLRHGQVVQTTLTPTAGESDDEPMMGLNPVESTVIASVQPNMPAAQAGLRAGDHVTAIDGQAVLTPTDMIHRVQTAEPNPNEKAPARPLTISVERGGQTLQFQVRPRKERVAGTEQWLIGTEVSNGVTIVHLPFRQALSHSLSDNKQYSLLIVDLVGRLVSHRASLQSLTSPIGIAPITGDAVRQASPLPLFWITALISLNLGILNLLPIPVLDGGMILFLLVEAVLRHDVSLRIKERIYQAGFAFLLILMTVVVFNDIVRAVR